MGTPTVQTIEDEIAKMDPALKRDSEAFKIAVILMSAAVVGPTQKALLAFTHYPRRLVAMVWSRARRQRIFVRGKVCADWLDKDGGMAFWLDVATVQGLLERRSP
jgi:hypothetical protein